jgi:diguanylate cyclase
VESCLRAENKRLRSQIAEIKRQYANLEEQAIRDPLTGMYNRRYLESILTHTQSKQKVNPVSIVMLDMDNLKKINDTFGHATGDKALKIIGEQLGQMTRPEDVVCRYGGDEFIIFLHNVSTETAYKRAEEWRQAIEGCPITYKNIKIGISITAGIATYLTHGDTLTKVIKAADEALYSAKRIGRNYVAIASGVEKTFYALPYDFLRVGYEQEKIMHLPSPKNISASQEAGIERKYEIQTKP